MKKMLLISSLCFFAVSSLHSMQTLTHWFQRARAGAQAALDPIKQINTRLAHVESKAALPCYSVRCLSLATLVAGAYAATQSESCKKISLHLVIDPLVAASAAGYLYWHRSSQIKTWKKLTAEEDDKISFISWHATDRHRNHWESALEVNADHAAVVQQLINDCIACGIRSAAALKKRISEDKKNVRAVLDELSLFVSVADDIVAKVELDKGAQVKTLGRDKPGHIKVMESCRTQGKYLQMIDADAHDKLLIDARAGNDMAYIDHVVSRPTWKFWQWKLMPRSQEIGSLYWDLVRLYARICALEDVAQSNSEAIDKKLKEKKPAHTLTVTVQGKDK